MRTLELKIPPLILGLLLGAVMVATARLFPATRFHLPGRQIIAESLGWAGVLIAVLGVISFGRAGTSVNPMNPDAASRLVVSGIYRRTRNPMYLGMLLVLLGCGFALANALALVLALAFIPLMNRLQIVPEERILATRFGADFVAYQSAVPRWL